MDDFANESSHGCDERRRTFTGLYNVRGPGKLAVVRSAKT